MMSLQLKCVQLVFLLSILINVGDDLKAQYYDVEVTHVNTKCLKVVEFIGDTQEDLFGFISIGCYVMQHASSPTTIIKKGSYSGSPSFFNNLANTTDQFDFFNRERTNPMHIEQGQVINSGAYQRFPNLTYSQLMSFEFLLGGSLSDDEPIAIRYKHCTACSYVQNSLTGYRLVRMSNYKSQIDAMSTNSSKFLQMGDDTIMELNFYEGDSNSSHIRFNFKIKVTKK